MARLIRCGHIGGISLKSAVLYSVENGSTREFWVVTPDYQVKVLEIDVNKIATPTTSWGSQVGDSITFSETFSSNDDVAFGAWTINAIDGASFLMRVETTATWTSGSGFQVRSQGNRANSNADESQPFDSNSADLIISGAGTRGGGIVDPLPLPAPSAGIATATLTILEVTAGAKPMEYEAWISSTKTEAYVTIKHDLDGDEFQVLDLITINPSGISSVVNYSNGASVAPRPNNWRNNHEDFLQETNQEINADACYELYEDNPNINSQTNVVFYSVDLSQPIGGGTLQAYLEGTVGSQTIAVDRIATINATNCTVDTTTSQSALLTSRGVGSVEGISVY